MQQEKGKGAHKHQEAKIKKVRDQRLAVERAIRDEEEQIAHKE